LVKFLLNENEVSVPVETKGFPYCNGMMWKLIWKE
jgi:hypothetical protein